MATSGARTAVPRVAWRVVRAVEFLLVAALTIYYGFLNLPRAAAAASSALRVAASLAVDVYIFIVANAIGMVIFVLSRRRRDDDDASSSSDASRLFSKWWPSDGDAQDRYLPSPGPPLMLASPGAPLMLPAPPAATDTEAREEEDKEKPVFVDKKAVHVTTVRAQAPRRSRSEKTAAGGGGGGAARRRRAAAPEMLRRVESENGRQRQRAEPEVSPVVEPGSDDEEEFRRYIDAYISKQQARFQCEESAAAAAASGKGGGAVVAGAVVAVK